MNFKEKVQSMTGKEIVMAMVNGLKAQHVKVDMDSWGSIHEGVCIGCAATNTICQILGKTPTVNDVRGKIGLVDSGLMPQFIDEKDLTFVEQFEFAVNRLRLGNVEGYNQKASSIGIAILPLSELPVMDTTDYKYKLHAYETYANSL